MKEMVSTTPTKARTGTAVRKRGRARVSDILDAAQRILVERGLANLTTRNVADALEISVGNLAYYFPSKNALLLAIVAHVIEGYDDALSQELKTFPDDPRQRLEAFLHYMIKDAKKSKVQGFFYQFWGLSTHSEEAAQARTQMYEHFAQQIVALLGDIHPNKKRDTLDNMALGILTCLEGLHVVYGSGNIDPNRSTSFDKYIFRQLLIMAAIKVEP